MVHEAGLSREQARRVDAAVAPYVESLPWKPCTDLVAAKIIEADPEAAEARRVAESLSRFVSTGQSDEFGLKTLIVRANAGDVIFFVAMCDRIAQCLLADGDTDPVDVRRSKAVGILAQPALALALLERHAAVAPADPDEPGRDEPAELVGVDRPCETCGRADGDATNPAAAPFPVDPDRMRPQATLYVRISAESLVAGSGVAVCGGTVARAPSGWSPCSRSRTSWGTAGSPCGRSSTCATSSRSTPTRSPPACGRR